MDSKLKIKIENGYITEDSMVAVMRKMSTTGVQVFDTMQEKNRKGKILPLINPQPAVTSPRT
jgi:hypothetical protein